jgi:hypothetical protein
MVGMEYIEDLIVNHWNVYIHVFKKHPVFDKLEEEGQNSPFLEELHYGCSYIKFDRDKSNDIVAKHYGSDYGHLHDDHYETVDNREAAREIFFDAERLFLSFKDIEDEKLVV